MGHSNLLAWLADTLRHKVTSAVGLWVWCHVCPLAVVPLAYITFYTTKTKGLPHQTEICSLMVQQWISYIVLKKVVESELKNPNYNKASGFWQNQFFIAKMKLLGQLKTFPNHTFSLKWNMLLINSEFFSILWPGITKFFLAFCSKTPKSLWNYMGRSTQIFCWFFS